MPYPQLLVAPAPLVRVMVGVQDHFRRRAVQREGRPITFTGERAGEKGREGEGGREGGGEGGRRGGREEGGRKRGGRRRERDQVGLV